MSKLCESCETRWLNNMKCENPCKSSTFFEAGYQQGFERSIEIIRGLDTQLAELFENIVSEELNEKTQD